MNKQSRRGPARAKRARRGRGAVRKVRIKTRGKQMTGKASLIPVLKFHERLGLARLLAERVTAWSECGVWMALVSGQATLRQWEVTTLRRELILVAWCFFHHFASLSGDCRI